ncbi:MAG: hypothetical protein C4551_10785 [Bacillota bacterium]|nr:MAG: hypothetical protein C4551_10785 [Bacillota bacterium]
MSVVLKARPAEPEYRAIHRVADALAPGMANTFVEAVRRVAGETALSELEAALARGDLAAAEAAVPWEKLPAELAPVGAAIRTGFEQAAQASVRYLPPRLRLELRFDLLNPRAVDWVRTHSGELIREVTDETRLAVREVIRRAFEEGMHPYTSARHIRSMVGLTRRQAQAVDNFRRRLVEEGVAGEKLDKRVEAYRQRLVRWRAKNIARTETLRASNEGQQELWRQAAEQGLIDPAVTRKEFITTPDDRLCDICAPLDGQRVGLEESFQTELGPVLTPPVHQQCRCAMRLVEVRP